MKLDHSGVTRWVFLIDRWAIKVPSPHRVIRGWLANQSEWQQRHRDDVEPPRCTLGHLVLIFRRATLVGTWDPENDLWASADSDECRDELKGSSWGLFPEGWRLIDFD